MGPGNANVNNIRNHTQTESECKAMCLSYANQCAGYAFWLSDRHCNVYGVMTSAPPGWNYDFWNTTTITGASGHGEAVCYSQVSGKAQTQPSIIYH